MSDDAIRFQQIDEQLSAGGAEPALETLVETFRREKRFHELFDARLMQCRQQLGLPLVSDSNLDDLDEPLRSQVEESYLAACREAGKLLLDEGHVRHAWMYLRTSGDNDVMRAGIRNIQTNDENIDEIIETAVYEGVDLEQGFKLLLEHYGTCNAITTYESVMNSRAKPEQQVVAAVLVRWLHAELLGNLLDSLEGEVARPDDPTTALREIVCEREDMFGEFTVHVDASHLSSVVRFARQLSDPEPLALALDLAEYGCRLHENFHHPGEPPFQETYPSHRLLFAARLGQRVDEAVEYFRQQTESADTQVDGTLPAEFYVLLLSQLGRNADAVAAHGKWLSADQQTNGIAPTLLELSRSIGEFDALLDACRKRGDLLGYTVGRIEAEQLKQS